LLILIQWHYMEEDEIGKSVRIGMCAKELFTFANSKGFGLRMVSVIKYILMIFTPATL